MPLEFLPDCSDWIGPSPVLPLAGVSIHSEAAAQNRQHASDNYQTELNHFEMRTQIQPLPRTRPVNGMQVQAMSRGGLS